MSAVFLDHISFALGPETYTLEEAAARGTIRSSVSALKGAGFVKHHVCGPRDTAYDLAYRAVQDLKCDLQNAGAIVYATTLPCNGNLADASGFGSTRDVAHLADFPASHLQRDMGMAHSFVVGLSQQGCTGMLGAVRVAKALLVAEPDVQQALCVTADRFPPGALYEQSYNLISDGAAACVVSTQPSGFRVHACHAITNGAMSLASDDEVVGSFFGYTHRIIQETLKKSGLSMGDLDWIIPQNTNVKAWEILARLLPFDHQRVFYPTVTEVAHVNAVDCFINLQRLVEQETVRPGEWLLLVQAGLGLNWQCVILQKV